MCYQDQEDKPICVQCNEPINVQEGGYYAHPDKPMHWDCYIETPEGKKAEERRIELKNNPYREVPRKNEEKKIEKRYCWFHRNDLGEKVEAVCYWYTIDGSCHHACEECAERYRKARKIHWYGERTGGTGSRTIIEPFDDDCDHDEYKKNMVTEEDESGIYDIIACRKCGGQRKRRFGGR